MWCLAALILMPIASQCAGDAGGEKRPLVEKRAASRRGRAIRRPRGEAASIRALKIGNCGGMHNHLADIRLRRSGGGAVRGAGAAWKPGPGALGPCLLVPAGGR